MDLAIKSFGYSELTSLKLRGLFERSGFKRAKVNKFEDYSLYVENKNFMQSENVITFMDLNGKLLALKPDITLSVVRNIQKKPLPALEKLYYVDEVYRLSREMREYKVHSQIGVEIIGRADSFTNIEAVDLALSSLSVISESFVLDVSHLGFVSGMLDKLDLPHYAVKQILSGIHSKSPHDVANALDLAEVENGRRNMTLSLCQLNGGFLESLPKAKELIISDVMQNAYDELEKLGQALCTSENKNKVNLDFSVVNDLDYYNGLIFTGYVEGIPRVVLTGGRYDNLMKKMGKQNGAIGFAVSLDELNTYFKQGKSHDFDYLVTYDDSCDYSGLLREVKKISDQGNTVRLENKISDLTALGLTWRKLCHFENGVLSEVAPC